MYIENTAILQHCSNCFNSPCIFSSSLSVLQYSFHTLNSYTMYSRHCVTAANIIATLFFKLCITKKINLSFGSNCIATPYCINLFKNIITLYSFRYCRLGLTQSKHERYSVQNCEHRTRLSLLSYCIELVCSKMQTFCISFVKRLRCNDVNRNVYVQCVYA